MFYVLLEARQTHCQMLYNMLRWNLKPRVGIIANRVFVSFIHMAQLVAIYTSHFSSAYRALDENTNSQ